jgi:hypothetical protein
MDREEEVKFLIFDKFSTVTVKLLQHELNMSVEDARKYFSFMFKIFD